MDRHFGRLSPSEVERRAIFRAELGASLGLLRVARLERIPLFGRTNLDSKPIRTLRTLAGFDGNRFNLVANGQKHVAERFAPMGVAQVLTQHEPLIVGRR